MTDRNAPDGEALAEAFGAASVAPEDDVVVCGGSVGSRVSRVVFALEYLGHRGDVTVLNGGIEAWGGRVGVGDRGVAATALPGGRVLLSHYDEDAVSLVDATAGVVA